MHHFHRIDTGARPHLCMNDWNLPIPVRRWLCRNQAGMGGPMKQSRATRSQQVNLALCKFRQIFTEIKNVCKALKLFGR